MLPVNGSSRVAGVSRQGFLQCERLLRVNRSPLFADALRRRLQTRDNPRTRYGRVRAKGDQRPAVLKTAPGMRHAEAFAEQLACAFGVKAQM